MKIDAYLLPPGLKGFKTGLFKEALGGVMPDGDYSGLLYMAPTRLLLETFRDLFHRELSSGRACYIPPALSTPRQLSRALCPAEKTIIPAALRAIALSRIAGCGMGLARTLSDFIGELRLNYPGEGAEELRERLGAVFAELGTHEEVSRRAYEGLDAMGKYDAVLEAHAAVDAEGALALSASAVKRPVKRLILEGFYEVGRAEANLLEALIRNAEKTLITIPVSSAEDDLTHCWSNFLKERFDVEPRLVQAEDGLSEARFFYPAASMEEELEAISRHIKSSFISGRLRELEEVLVVLPEISKYREMLERVFERYGIPYHVAAPRRASETGRYQDMLSLIEAVSEDYPRLKFSRFLCSPHFRIGAALRVKAPGIALSSGLVKGREAWLRAFKDAGVIEEGREIFERLRPLEAASFEGYSGALDAFEGVLRGLGFQAEPALEDITGSLRLLDRLLDERPVLSDVADALGQALEGAPVETEADGVKVTGFYEARGLEPRFLYMAGLKDGDMPSRQEMDLYLPDGVRKRLGLIDMQRHLLLQEYIFNRLAAASGAIRFSHPVMEGDKFFLPSPFLSGWEEKTERLFGVFSKEEEMLRRGGAPFSSYIGEIKGLRRFDATLNVTHIDSYRACPRRFFLEKLLDLKPPKIKEYEVEPETIGIIAHEIMQKIIPLARGETGAFVEGAVPLIEETLRGRPLEPYFKALIMESFIRMLPAIHALEGEIREAGYSLLEAERKIEGEPLKGIKLKGKMDRIDVKEDGSCEVIDYKTGAADLSGVAIIERGESLQLPLYAALLKGMGMMPERAGIYSLKEMKIEWIPKKKDLKAGRGLDFYMDAALGFLKETVSSMREGDFKALPLQEQTCSRCDESPYCPYVLKGSGEHVS